MSEEKRSSGFFNGLILGGLIGAALVWLNLTEDGKKTKKLLLKKGQKVIDDLPEKVKELEKQGEEFAQKAEEIKQKLEAKARELTPEIKEKLKNSLAHIEKTQERGRQAAATARQRFFTRKGKKLN